MNNMCVDCKFWNGDVHEDIEECRRYPPTDTHAGPSVFPLVYASKWCGEFVMREEQ